MPGLDTGESVLGEQHVIVETEEAKVVLTLDPRAPGHTIVVWKSHRHDFTELDESSTATLFTLCRDVARAMTQALAGVERVYLVTMCDGPVNHLRVQLIPRYRGSPIGSTRPVDRRSPVIDGGKSRPPSLRHSPGELPASLGRGRLCDRMRWVLGGHG